MSGPFIHNIDPIIAEVGGFYFWWYGASYSPVFLIGSTLAVILFCKLHRRNFLEVADVLAIAAAFIMAFGRIGNFIDGQIVGSLTDMPWGVRFPDQNGFRHPVVLYDGLKNLLLVPLLLLIKRTKPPRGVLVAHFILWYGFLRIFIDFFREYRSSLYGLPPGQEFNMLMTVIGIGLLIRCYRREKMPAQANAPPAKLEAPGVESMSGPWMKKLIFLVLLILPIIIPSDWTQDVPARYGDRHPGMTHSMIYPEIPAGPAD